jgi:hypothetical protein
MNIEVIELAIGKLDLQHGDILVMKVDRDDPRFAEMTANLHGVQSMMPPGVRVLIVPKEVDFEVLQAPDPEAA